MASDRLHVIAGTLRRLRQEVSGIRVTTEVQVRRLAQVEREIDRVLTELDVPAGSETRTDSLESLMDRLFALPKEERDRQLAATEAYLRTPEGRKEFALLLKTDTETQEAR